MVYLHLPSKNTVRKDLHFVESKIIKPVYSDVTKPTLTLLVQALDTIKQVSTGPNLLVLGFGAAAAFVTLSRR